MLKFKRVHPHIPPPHSINYGVLVASVIQLGAIRFSVTKRCSCALSEGAQSFNTSIIKPNSGTKNILF